MTISKRMGKYPRQNPKEKVQAKAGKTSRNTKTGWRGTKSWSTDGSGQNHRAGNCAKTDTDS